MIESFQTRLRDQKKTLRKVADETGIPSGRLSDYLSGVWIPRPPRDQVIADALGMSVDEMLRLIRAAWPAQAGRRDRRKYRRAA